MSKFLDFNRDGYLDLVVANYVDFDLKTAPLPEDGPCTYKGILVGIRYNADFGNAFKNAAGEVVEKDAGLTPSPSVMPPAPRFDRTTIRHGHLRAGIAAGP